MCILNIVLNASYSRCLPKLLVVIGLALREALTRIDRFSFLNIQNHFRVMTDDDTMMS